MRLGRESDFLRGFPLLLAAFLQPRLEIAGALLDCGEGKARRRSVEAGGSHLTLPRGGAEGGARHGYPQEGHRGQHDGGRDEGPHEAPKGVQALADVPVDRRVGTEPPKGPVGTVLYVHV